MSDVFANIYGVELFCSKTPEIPKPALTASIARYCPDVAPLDGDPISTLLSFIHPSRPVQLLDARLPAQTLVTVTTGPTKLEELEGAIQQAWDFPEARTALEKSTASVLVTDLMSSSLDHRDRVDLFQRALRGVLECVPCNAIWWKASDRIVDPRTWLERFDSGNGAHLLATGAVNVRLFNVGNPGARAGEKLMDTLGLGALGLPDLQCHFSGLEPGAVAGVLYNTAWYIFSEGDVIEDGHTIDGVGTRWRCQHEDSLGGPDRVVLDLNPGPPYAAGNRS